MILGLVNKINFKGQILHDLANNLSLNIDYVKLLKILFKSFINLTFFLIFEITIYT